MKKKTRFGGLFTKRKKPTAAELMAEIRPIAVDYVSEAYIAYDFMKDLNTDTPDTVKIIYVPLRTVTLADVDEFGRRLREEFGVAVVPFPMKAADRRLDYVRGRKYPRLFS